MRKTSPGSPRFSAGVSGLSTKSSNKKQVNFNNKTKKKLRKIKQTAHQASLTDTENNRMHDLLKKGYIPSKVKKNTHASKTKAKSISGSTLKNKLKLAATKNPSISRSPVREYSQNNSVHRKMKTNGAISDIWKFKKLRGSGETISISSEKPKAAYFKNTLDSHNKIRSGAGKLCKTTKIFKLNSYTLFVT